MGKRVQQALIFVFLMAGSIAAFGLANSFPIYGVFFLFGMVVSRWQWLPSPAIQRRFLFALTGVISVVCLVPELRHSVAASGAVMVDGHDVTRGIDILLALLTVPFVAANVRIRDTSLVRHAGNLSFPLYLVHWVTLGPYVAGCGHLPGWERLPWFFLYLATTAIATLVIYLVVDRPSENLRRAWVRKNLPPQTRSLKSPLISERSTL